LERGWRQEFYDVEAWVLPGDCELEDVSL